IAHVCIIETMNRIDDTRPRGRRVSVPCRRITSGRENSKDPDKVRRISSSTRRVTTEAETAELPKEERLEGVDKIVLAADLERMWPADQSQIVSKLDAVI